MKAFTGMSLGVVALCAAIVTCRVRLADYRGEIVVVPASVKAIHTFNDLAAFEVSSSDDRVFRFQGSPARPEAYLRFAIPNFDPNGYRLRFEIQAPPKAAEACRARFAIGGAPATVVRDGHAKFDILLNESADRRILWQDGKSYVGVCFPKDSLSDGDEVRLESLEFVLEK